MISRTQPPRTLVAALSLGLAMPVLAAELTQGFVNPDFGGSPLNGSYLLSNATAQNAHKAHPTPAATSASTTSASSQTSTATQFAQQVNQLVMSNLAYRLVNQAFGSSSDAIRPGSAIDTGVNTIAVQAYAGGTRVIITDKATGGQSVITIPSY